MSRLAKACVVAALLVMLFKETTSTRLDARDLKPNQQYMLSYGLLNNDITDFVRSIRQDANGNFWKNLRSDRIFNDPYKPYNPPKVPPQQPEEDNGSDQPEYIYLP